MQSIILTIIAVILVLLFIGVLFLVMLIYYNNKRKQLEREKQVMKDNFEKQLLLSQLEVQEQTLSIISQEIHDNVGQTLAVAKVQLNIFELDQQETNKARIHEIKDTLSTAMTDLRDIARSLNTDRIKSFNLTESIAYQVNRINKTGSINCTFETANTEQPLNEQVKLILFRIMQESLQNIIKHSQAKEVRILFNYQPANFCITITDDGIGFDVDAISKKTDGLGLQNIISRAALIGGKINIASAADKGTSIQIITPYE